MKPSPLDSKKAEQMRNAYDGTSEYYDSRYRHIQYLKYSILLHQIIKIQKLPQIQLRGLVLDNGGGTGLFLEFLQKLSKFSIRNSEEDEKINQILEFTCYLISKKYRTTPISLIFPPTVICDVSFEMLQIARKFQDSIMLYGLVSCDSAHLPFRPSQFSTITAFTVFQNIENINKAIEESHRVLVDQGCLGISILKKSYNKFRFAEMLGKCFDDIYPVNFEKERGDFQKMIVQNGKYSQFYDLEKVEDFFLTAKKL
ncbi:MAG: class I SAM-dependent methyltransferase [Promethearchaeota archaeon]|nr:MAG: class I SAM-dependent methyltransferase [Candidatus Lokiarchaeota archaeon]